MDLDVFVNIFSEDEEVDAETPAVIDAGPGVEDTAAGGFAQLPPTRARGGDEPVHGRRGRHRRQDQS